MNCGKMHKHRVQCRDDDLYIKVKCKTCGKTINHLRCGDDPLDIYKLYDPVMDERYY